MKEPIVDVKKRRKSRPHIDLSSLGAEGQAQLALHYVTARHWTDSPVAAICPPGSLLAAIAEAWYTGTSIPLAIPLGISIAMLSGILAARGVVLSVGRETITPEQWIVILGPSGCGKSYTYERLRNIFGRNEEIDASGCVSTAALIRILAARPQGWWVCDEWGQFVRQIERVTSPLSDARGILLKIYSGETVRRDFARSENETIIHSPRVSIAGITVDETYHSIVTTESVLDGFGSRYSYAYADPDSSRPWLDYPAWEVATDSLHELWKKNLQRICPSYQASNDAIEFHRAAFRRLYGSIGEVPEAFYRRCLHRHHKLALLCHVLTAPHEPELSVADYDSAERMVIWLLRGGKRLLDSVTGGELGRLIERAVAWGQRRRTTGQPITRRDLQIGVWGVTNAGTAEFLLRCVAESIFDRKHD